MLRVAIYNLVGIEIEDSYPWTDTLSIAKWNAPVNKEEYENCKTHIKINRCEKLNISDCREIGGGLLISKNTFVDLNHGIRLDRNDSKNITLSVTQECNEWLNICLQLLLLELDSTLIHAAALEKNGEVVVLPSWGGVGKTATVVRMINEDNWKLLGDDLVILKKDEILPYLKPFVIYPYHKPLFPEVFKENKRRIVSSMRLNDLMGKSIPTVKRLLRPAPKLLSFARKHNPQSMRIDPKDIFAKGQLSMGGTLKKVVWLERSTSEHVTFEEKSAKQMASKTTAVTMMEIFSDRLNCLYALNGAGVFSYQDTQVKMYNLITASYKEAGCYELEIPTNVPIKEVGSVVIDHVVDKG